MRVCFMYICLYYLYIYIYNHIHNHCSYMIHIYHVNILCYICMHIISMCVWALPLVEDWFSFPVAVTLENDPIELEDPPGMANCPLPQSKISPECWPYTFDGQQNPTETSLGHVGNRGPALATTHHLVTIFRFLVVSTDWIKSLKNCPTSLQPRFFNPNCFWTKKKDKVLQLHPCFLIPSKSWPTIPLKFPRPTVPPPPFRNWGAIAAPVLPSSHGWVAFPRRFQRVWAVPKRSTRKICRLCRTKKICFFPFFFPLFIGSSQIPSLFERHTLLQSIAQQWAEILEWKKRSNDFPETND